MDNVIDCEFESVDTIRQMVRDIGPTRTIQTIIAKCPELEVFARAVVKNTLKRWR